MGADDAGGALGGALSGALGGRAVQCAAAHATCVGALICGLEAAVAQLPDAGSRKSAAYSVLLLARAAAARPRARAFAAHARPLRALRPH